MPNEIKPVIVADDGINRSIKPVIVANDGINKVKKKEVSQSTPKNGVISSEASKTEKQKRSESLSSANRWANVTEPKAVPSKYKTDDYIDVLENKPLKKKKVVTVQPDNYAPEVKVTEIDAPTEKEAETMMEEDFGKKEFDAYQNINNINKDLIFKNETDAVKELRDKFKGSGFIFEETGIGNKIRVSTSTNGGLTTINSMELDLVSPSATKETTGLMGALGNREQEGQDQYNKLIDFMKKSILKKTDKDFLKKDVKDYGQLVNLMADNPYKYGEEFLNQYDTDRWFDNQYRDLVIESKSLKRDEESLLKQYDEFVKNPTTSEQESEIKNKINSLDERKSILKSKYDDLGRLNNKLKVSSAVYYKNKEKQGNTLGLISKSFMKGAFNIEKALAGTAADIMPYVLPEGSLMPDVQKEKMKAAGMSDTEIKDYASKQLRKQVIPEIEKGLENLVSFGTTNEYIQSKDRGDLEKVGSFLSESIGTALSGGGNPMLQKIAFFSQSYNAIEDEMNSSQFDGLNQFEKKLISVPYAMTIGALENLGFKFTTGATKNPLFNKLVNNIVFRTFSNLPKDASATLMQNELKRNTAAMLANTGLRIFGGALVEGGVEGVQQLDEIAIKNISNALTDKDYFKDVPDITTAKGINEALGAAATDAYYGALGGLIMSAGSESVSAIRDGYSNRKSDDDFAVFANSLKDNNLRSSIESDIKSQIVSGDITKEEAKAQIESMNKSYSILQSIPDNLDIRDQRESFNLILEKQKIQKETEGKDPALVAAQTNRINEINNELKTISENAVQKQTTSEVSVQPETRISEEVVQGEPTAEPQGVTEEGQKEEVNQYIANIGAEARIGSVIDPIVDRMSNAEYINDKEIDNAIEKIFNEVDSLEKSDYSAETKAAVSEKLLNIAEKLDNYEFRTKTETVETTKAGTTTGARKTSESIQKIRAEKYFNGVNATVNGQEVTLVDRNGRVEATMPNGEIVVLDTPTMQIAENGFEFDDNDALVAVTVTDRLGNNTRMTGDQALDFAIRDRENKIGVVEQADFDIAYQEVERKYIKEAPKKKVEKELPIAATKAEPVDVDDEVRKLEELLKRDDPNFQLDSEITQEEKKEELVSKAIEKMSESDINDMSKESFDAEFPSPDVKTYPIEVKENSELANKLKRMGLKDLIGKKINLVMADQLKVGEVMGKKRMGGPFFPLIDKLFGKVAWASINKTAAKAIVNGAIKSDYTVVYNMNPSAIDSNAAITETFEDLMQSLPKNKQKEIFSAIQEQVLKNKYATKTDQVRAIAKSSNTLSEFFTELDKLDVDTISAVVKNIMPSRDVDAGTKIGKLLQNEGITIETIREMNVEQFASELPAGALTMVLEVTDKSGNKVTSKTADEAIITPEQQDEEGLPKHNNYPIYVRGKAIAMLNETVPFWNILKESINNINVKVAGIVREKSGRRLTAKEAVSNEMRSASMTASVAKKAIEKTNTQYNRFLSVIAKSFPNVEVIASQEEFDALLKDLNTKKLSTKNAKVYGAVYKGKLYLNPSLENYNTPVHEFGHIWINTAKVASKQLYRKGISLVKGTEYENNVRENKEYQRVIKQMKVDGASDIDIDNYIYEEALATAIGDKGESFVTASQRLDFKNWMRKLFSFVKSMTGISKYNAEQLEDITLDEFVQAVSIDIMSGTELFKGVKTNISDALQLMTNGSNSIEYIMSVARDNGISDAGIKKYLANQGFSEQAIKDAFKAQVKAPSAAKILGKPTVIKVTVNEYTALKDQIRMEARAARDAKADLNIKRKMLSDSISNMVKLGKIKTSQAGVLIKRISYLNLDNPVMVERFTNYAERVFQRADYQDRLSKAFALRKSIRKDLKTDNQAEVVGMAKEFTKIDPSLVEDIDTYMQAADKVKNAVKPSRRKDEEYVMKQAANIADISEFSKNEIDRQEQIKIDELIATYEDIEGLSKDMSFNEIQKIINSLKENPDETVDKESKAKEFLVSRMNGMKSTLETMFKTGVDPMTGEEITFEDSQKDLMKRVLKIDLNEMSTREAIKIVEGVDNFLTNQITSGLEAAASSYEGALNVKSLVNRGKVARALRLFGIKTIGKVYSDQLYSLPNLMEKMFGGVSNSIDIMRKMGLLNVINGVNKAIRQHNQIIDKYSKQLFAKGKDFMDAKNVYERGMLAELKRNIIGTESEMQTEFQNRVKILKESIDLLIEDGNSKEKKMGELYKEVYDKLNVDSMDMDVINSNASKNNLEAVDWWINEWSKYKPELFDVSLSVYNTMLTSDLSYTPRSIKKLSSKDTGLDESLTNQNGSFNVSINNVDKNKSGVLMETTRTRPTNGYISLDFDTNNSKALKSALTDINTASAIRQVDGFLSSKEFKKLVPESDDRTILERRISTYIKRAKGKNVVPRDTIEYLNKFVNYVTSLGVGKALAGVNQTLMQTTPVLVNTFMNAGRLDFVNADFNAWLDETGMPISNRGFESQSTIDSIDRQLEAKGQTTDQVFKKIADINQWWLKQLLVKPDVWVARSSFKSYYLQNLNRRGISTDIDWKNHKMDKEAAEYAQIMVDRQQNISDPMLAGEFLASENPYVQMTRKIFLPFASFIINQKARMYNDLITVSSGTATNEDKAIAWRSLRGLGAELATYQLLGYGIKLLYDQIAAWLLGDEDDEETKKKKIINATKNPIKSVLNDIISPLPMLDDIVTMGLNLGLGQYPWMDDKEIKDAVNSRNKVLELKGEDPMDDKAKADYIEKIKKEATYQLYISDDNDRKYGMIGIAGDTYKELGEISKLYATGEFIDDYQGRETPKKLLEADRKDVGLAVFPTLLYSTGLLPKDVGAISRDYIKRIKKKAVTEKQYDRYETVQKDLGRNLKSWEIDMVKDKKESETAIDEIKFIERNGGLTERQGREYLKLMKAIGEPTVSDLTKIKNGQTADQILK